MAFARQDAAKVLATDLRDTNGTRKLARISLASENVLSGNCPEQIIQQMIAFSGEMAADLRGSLTIPVDVTANTPAQRPLPAGPTGIIRRLFTSGN